MSIPSKRLDKLESVRGFFSVYVVVHHLVFADEAFAVARKFFYFGQMSVMIFFMLSGFVIYYSSLGRDPKLDVKRYLKRRFRRIYPAFLIALLLSYVLRCILDGKLADPHWGELLGNLFQLQDKHPYSIVSPYLHNLSLWTLSYEVFFYLLFIPVVLIGKNRSNLEFGIAAGLSALGYVSFWLLPNQFSLFLSYFFLWWVGIEFCKEYLKTGNVTFQKQLRTLAVLAVLAIAWSVPMLQSYFERGEIGRNQFPFIQAQHFILVFLLTFTSIAWFRMKFIGLEVVTGWAFHLAPISYALYVFHLPVIYFALELQLTGSAWLDLLWEIPLLFGLAWLAEKPIQKFVNKYIR